MALSIPIIIGLATFGNYIGKQNRSNKVIRQSLNKDSIPSGNNVYHSNRLQEVDLEERKQADTRFRDSMDPCNTNIIPPFYNTLYDGKCGPLGVNISEETILPQVQEYKNPNTLDAKILQGPMWANPVPNYFRETEMNEMNSNENGNVSSLTGLPMDNTHNNMVPFFGGKVKQSIDKDINATLLETFTGTGDIIQRNKEEVGPMFELRRENIYGVPNVPDELRNERMYQSNLKTNILPAPQIRTFAPKPEEMARPRYRTVDELRSIGDPRITYEGRPSGAPLGSTQRGIQAPVTKNHGVKTFYLGQDHFTPANSYIPSRTMLENFENLKPTTRDSEEHYFGIAGSGARVGQRAGICKPNYTVATLRKTTGQYQRNPESTNVMVRSLAPTMNINVI